MWIVQLLYCLGQCFGSESTSRNVDPDPGRKKID